LYYLYFFTDKIIDASSSEAGSPSHTNGSGGATILREMNTRLMHITTLKNETDARLQLTMNKCNEYKHECDTLRQQVCVCVLHNFHLIMSVIIGWYDTVSCCHNTVACYEANRWYY
jgi:hypothetical protein